MDRKFFIRQCRVASSIVTLAAVFATSAPSVAAPKRGVRTASVSLPQGAQRPSREIVLSVGRGELYNLPASVSDVWTSNAGVADVYVSSARQIHIFGKTAGEASVYAKNKAGIVVFSANIRVGENANSLDQMLRLAMPDGSIRATSMNGLVLLTGVVAAPEDGAEAERLVKAFLGDKVEVVSRLRTATPLQVNLQVKIAEVSRSLAKQIGVNLITRDTTGGFNVGIAQGRGFGTIGNASTTALPQLDASSLYGLPAGSLKLPFDPVTGRFITQGGTVGDFAKLGLGAGTTSLGFLGKLFGVDVGTAIDLAETDGLVTMLAEPNLTAVSGETASFLAGGEFPIPVSQTLGQVTIEYKQYGVSLSFTPTVLADGRISMRVRPEVSQLSTEGSVTLNGFTVPAITTRRTETTVELGSGQSFMIGGLLQNNNANSIQKAPGLGDVPVLGALFRSTSYRRAQTELMIIVTPYLVKPVSAGDIHLPTDGLKNPTDLQNFLLGQDFSGRSGGERPKPTMAPPVTVPAPSTGGISPSAYAPQAATGSRRPAATRSAPAKAAPTPGFSGN
ncbi:type II and III secretion system protein family protein [Sphingomonas sp.]|uniref:type II and III secretion system protein family protein n=1 Tax=Sphingomonas sp. TaxID=28214 RepID=UPI0025F61530|nr:type II and III secretion system protein family protein [Sphingomonas sp.]